MAKLIKKWVKVTFPQKLIKEPVIFKMAKKYDVIPNIRRARVTDEIGEIYLELAGVEQNLQKGIKYMTKTGVTVEPITGDVIE